MKPIQRLAFTLTELLIVVAILAILMSLLSPSLKRAIESARAVQCGQQLKSIGIAFAVYAEDNEDFYPVNQRAVGVDLPNQPQGESLMLPGNYRPYPFNDDQMGMAAFGMNNGVQNRSLGAAVGLYRDYLPSVEAWYCPTLESLYNEEYDQDESKWEAWSESYNSWEAPDQPTPKITSNIGYYIVPSEEILGSEETRMWSLYEFWSGSKQVRGDIKDKWALPGAMRPFDAPDLTLVADLSLAWRGDDFGLHKYNSVYYNPRHNTKGGDGESSLLLNDGSVNFLELDSFRDIPTAFNHLSEDAYTIKLDSLHPSHKEGYEQQYRSIPQYNKKLVMIPIFNGDVRQLYRGQCLMAKGAPIKNIPEQLKPNS